MHFNGSLRHRAPGAWIGPAANRRSPHWVWWFGGGGDLLVGVGKRIAGRVQKVLGSAPQSNHIYEDEKPRCTLRTVPAASRGRRRGDGEQVRRSDMPRVNTGATVCDHRPGRESGATSPADADLLKVVQYSGHGRICSRPGESGAHLPPPPPPLPHPPPSGSRDRAEAGPVPVRTGTTTRTSAPRYSSGGLALNVIGVETSRR